MTRNHRPRRFFRALSGVAAITTALGASAFAYIAVTAIRTTPASATTTTNTYTLGEHTASIPAGVTTITYTLIGAGGGGGETTTSSGGAGGAAAKITGTITLSTNPSGVSLKVFVGGGGKTASTTSGGAGGECGTSCTDPAAGGSGGSNMASPSHDNASGGGGSGSLIETSTGTVLVVAGGGGGGGAGTGMSHVGEAGGAAGIFGANPATSPASTGASGKASTGAQKCTHNAGNGGGGGGGSTTGTSPYGATGGCNGQADTGGPTTHHRPGTHGTPATKGAGPGAGGTGGNSSDGPAGGGGGGGWAGGGGAGGSAPGSGASGGGGSSFYRPSEAISSITYTTTAATSSNPTSGSNGLGGAAGSNGQTGKATIAYTTSGATTTTTVAKTSPSGTPYSGESVTFTATVTASSVAVTAGTVAFYETPNGGSRALITGCGAKAVNSTGKVTCTTTSLVAATTPYAITATYSGTSGTYAASNGHLSQAVVQATPTLSTQTSATGVAVDSSVHDTATLSGGYGTLTGTVTFKVFHSTTANCTGTALFTGTGTISSGRATSPTWTATPGGSYKWYASYTTPNNSVSHCGGANETFAVGFTAEITGKTTTVPSKAYGSTVTLAEVGLPTNGGGTVTFWVGSGSYPASTHLCSFTLTAGRTSCTYTIALTPATSDYHVHAHWSVTPATSSNSVTLKVTKAATPSFTVKITGSKTATSRAYGSTIVISETGLPTNGGGTVTMWEGTSSYTSSAASTHLCHFTLTAGTVSCTYTITLGVTATYRVHAYWTGNTDYTAGSSANYVNLTVTAAVSSTRVAGSTADGSAVKEFTRTFPYQNGVCPGSRTAVVATTKVFQDALSSQFLAQHFTTGTLLTPTTSLSSLTSSALRNEGITSVYIVGGSLAVSTGVAMAIGNLTAYNCGGVTRTGGKISVHRLAGPTQYGTAKAVVEFVGSAPSLSLSGAYGRYNDTSGVGSTAASGSQKTAILASGAEFQDALAASVIAYHTKTPLVLTPATTLSPTAVAALKALSVKQVILMGGPFAVANSVVTSLVATGFSVIRVAGADGTDTARELARFETAASPNGLGWTPGHRIMVARGTFFSDGLCGAVLDSPLNHTTGPSGTVRPLLLTESPSSIGSYLTSFLETTGHTGINATALKTIRALTILGGSFAITTSTVNQMLTDLNH